MHGIPGEMREGTSGGERYRVGAVHGVRSVGGQDMGEGCATVYIDERGVGLQSGIEGAKKGGKRAQDYRKNGLVPWICRAHNAFACVGMKAPWVNAAGWRYLGQCRRRYLDQRNACGCSCQVLAGLQRFLLLPADAIVAASSAAGSRCCC